MKVYDIELSGVLMTDEVFDHLMDDIMLSGVKYRWLRKTIEYDDLKENALEDLKYFEDDFLISELNIPKSRIKHHNSSTVIALGENNDVLYKAELITYVSK